MLTHWINYSFGVSRPTKSSKIFKIFCLLHCLMEQYLQQHIFTKHKITPHHKNKEWLSIIWLRFIKTQPPYMIICIIWHICIKKQDRVKRQTTMKTVPVKLCDSIFLITCTYYKYIEEKSEKYIKILTVTFPKKLYYNFLYSFFYLLFLK